MLRSEWGFADPELERDTDQIDIDDAAAKGNGTSTIGEGMQLFSGQYLL